MPLLRLLNWLLAGILVGFLFASPTMAQRPKLAAPAKSCYQACFALHGFNIPFRFSLNKDDKGKYNLFLGNEGALNPFLWKSNPKKGEITSISIPGYDAELDFDLHKQTGNYKRFNLSKPFNPIPFTFKEDAPQNSLDPLNGEKPDMESLTWDLLITNPEGKENKAVALINTAKNGMQTGSILTNSGDYRYMYGQAGTADSSHWLSCFDGSSPVLFTWKYGADKTGFTGYLVSPGGVSKVKGTLNANAALSNPYTLSKMKEGKDKLSFVLENAEGKKVSLTDPAFRYKVVLVTIMGSWCPNCLDEAIFLKNRVGEGKEYKPSDVVVLGISFERKPDPVLGRKAIARFKERLGLPFEILFGGQATADSVLKVFPELEQFKGYPTTFYLDRKGKVVKIYTGFSGPATGKYHEEYAKDFKATLDRLLLQK